MLRLAIFFIFVTEIFCDTYFRNRPNLYRQSSHNDNLPSSKEGLVMFWFLVVMIILLWFTGIIRFDKKPNDEEKKHE